MQLGFVSAILPDLSLQQVAHTAAEMGYDCIEVMCWPVGKAERRYAGVTHIDVSHFTKDDAARVKETMAAAGVSISALGYYPNALSPDPAESEVCIAHIRKVIAASAMLGLGRMNTFIGRDWKKSVDENWPRFLEVWRPMIKFAEDQGVKVGIENCPMLFTKDEWPGGKNLAVSPVIWRRMFEAIPSPNFGLNYDPSHLVWQHMDWIKPLKEFSSRIFHVHAKDVKIERQKLDDVGILAHPNEYHRPKLPGLGEIDWGGFVTELERVGYRGPVCVEVEDRDFESTLELRKQALRKTAEVLRPLIPRNR